jgi:hypothetical protein
MSISTLNALRPTPSFRPAAKPVCDDPQPAPAPAPEPQPEPAPAPAPTADIDFSNVDTPQKAALLPSLNGAAFLLTLNAISNAAQFGAGLTSSLQMTLGQATNADLSYSLNADPNAFGLNGSGTIGGNAFSENWAFNDQGLLISGSVGNAQEALTVSQQDDGLHLDGTIGSVEVHEIVNNSADGNGVVFGGTIGDQALNQTLTVGQDESGNSTIQARGTLGDAEINYDETVGQNDTGLSVTGQGSVAGNALQINHTLTFDFGAPPSGGDGGDPGSGDGGDSGKKA